MRQTQTTIGLVLTMLTTSTLAATSGPVAAPVSLATTANTHELLEARYRELLLKHPNDPGLKAYEERLALLQERAAIISKCISDIRRQSLSNILDAPLSPRSAKTRRPPPPRRYAADLLVESADMLADSLAKPNVAEEEIALLRDYYDARVWALTENVSQSAWKSRVADPHLMAEIYRFCLVLPFLTTPDEGWTDECVRRLPDWLLTESSIQIVQGFALSQGRLRTAYRFHIAAVKRNQPTTQPSSFVAFLGASAKALVIQRDYRAAIACYRSAIDLAERDSTTDLACDLRFALAELLDLAGHPELAANEMQQLIAAHPDTNVIGKVAMLRMKYLYAASGYTTILQECPLYEADPRCCPYRPQLLYLRWVTHRRMNQGEQATTTQEVFLRAYPEHPLAADMYYSSAMSALAASNYSEALRILEIVEYRFPAYKGMAKVKDIRTRVQAKAGEK